MREKKTHLYVDSREKTLLLHSLVELKNQFIQQGKKVLHHGEFPDHPFKVLMDEDI